MSAVKDLAGELVEFGGDLHTMPGWLARRADGSIVDGYRYARLVACGSSSCPGAACDACAWHYVGRAFASEDAVTVLAEIIAHDVGMSHEPNRATPDPRPRCHFGRPHRWLLGWYDETGEWVERWAKCATCGQVEWEG